MSDYRYIDLIETISNLFDLIKIQASLQYYAKEGLHHFFKTVHFFIRIVVKANRSGVQRGININNYLTINKKGGRNEAYRNKLNTEKIR